MLLAFRIDEYDDKARAFFDRLDAELKKTWSWKNKPFEPARIRNVMGLWLLELEPSFPAFWQYGILMAALVLWLDFFKWLLLPSFIMMLTGLAWLPGVYMFFLKLGLRKSGSKAKVYRLTKDKALCELVWDR